MADAASHDMAALVLAAGKGTRLFSTEPKVLRPLLAEPMLAYVIEALRPRFTGRTRIVIGFGAELVREAFPDLARAFVLQPEQKGTGHALMTAWEEIKRTNAARCLVVNGDTPLLTAGTVERFLKGAGDAALAFATIDLLDPAGFGRVKRDEKGRVAAVVEAKDLGSAAGSGPAEVNAGLYCLDLAAIEPLLAGLGTENASREYYITDLIGLAVKAGLGVEGVRLGREESLLGVNTAAELVRAEMILRERIVEGWLARGAIIRSPESVLVGPGVELSPGTEINGPAQLLGRTVVGRARVGAFTHIRDSAIADGAEIREFSHLQGANVGPDCVVGPHARLRPGAVLKARARVGNFVEMKKSVLGEGAKANHLTYLGDAEVGAEANIGAGTITCNFDGKNKHKTTIGERAFIGSNTALVAPVTVGADALVGAGSTITKDVPAGEIGVGRARQVNLKRKKPLS